MSDVPTNAQRSTSGDGLPPTGGPRVIRVTPESIENAARTAYQAWKNWGGVETDANWERLDDALEALGRLLNANVV